MSERKKTIAIIRGGKDDYFRSMKNGANIIHALSKYTDKINVLDVFIDEKNIWFEKGVPSDFHRVFSKADFYIDFTNNKYAEYHDLAKKLKVISIFNDSDISTLNRINIKRILSQLNIESPKCIIIRDANNLEHNLKEVWKKFHTPIVIKEIEHKFNEKSVLTHSFIELYQKVKNILDKRSEVLIEEYAAGKHISIGIVPNYRNEELYISTPIEILNINLGDKNLNSKSLKNKSLMEHKNEKRSLFFLKEGLKNNMKNLVIKIYKSLSLNNHSMIDICLVEDKSLKDIKYSLKILDVHIFPQVFEDSRFDFILRNSGVDIGKYIIDRIEKLEEEEKIY